ARHAAREGVTVHVPDVLADPSSIHSIDKVGGIRAELYVPMLRERRCIGVVFVSREEVGRFSESAVALVHTLADQAVIAIENVRLFTELQEKNRALTEAHAQVTESLEQQTATADILRVISSSPTDLGPVMEAVAENAARVCGATDSSVFRLEGEHLRLVARRGSRGRPIAMGQSLRVSRGWVSGRAVIDRQTIHVEDVMAAEVE